MPRTLFRRVNPRRRSGISDWRSNGFPAGFVVATTIVGVNENSLDLYMEFTEAAILPTKVTVRTRKSADASEEHAQLDATIARWNASINPSIQGSIVGLNPSETWDVRWQFQFSDGSVHDYVWTNLTTKAAQTYPALNTYTPTRYLSPNGSDANDGLTYGTAWATWQKMVLSVPTNGIVQVDDGYYESTADSGSGTNERNSTLTIIPRNASWIGDDGADLANGHRIIVEPATRTSPTGSGNKNAGVWSLVTVNGPGRFGNVAGTAYQLWKWSASGITSATFVTASFRTNRGDDPERLHHHYRDSDYLSTPGGFAEYLYTNGRYRYGCWIDTTGDIYVRIPGTVDGTGTGVDPNTQYMTFSSISQTGISLKNGVNIRMTGIGFIGFGRAVYMNGTGQVVDHCYFANCFQPPRVDSVDNYVVHCRIIDTNMSADPPTFKTIDWSAVKIAGKMADGSAYGNKICGACEGQIHVSASKRLTFAHNYVRGLFNGLGTIGTANSTQLFYGWGTNIHDNVFTLMADDTFEPEQVGMCWKIWNNNGSKAISFLSTGPVHGGPMYVWNNTIWQNSGNFIGYALDGTRGAEGKVFSKFSSQSEPQSTIFFLHNTVYCDLLIPNFTRGATFAGDSAGGTTSLGTKVHEKHYWYGNLLMCAYRIMDEVNEQNIIEWFDDYNFYYTASKDAGSGGPSGIKSGGIHYTGGTNLKMSNYRSAQHQGTHSNLVGATTYEMNDASGGTVSHDFFIAQMVDPVNGNLALVGGSPLRNIVPPCPVTARLGKSLYNVGYQP